MTAGIERARKRCADTLGIVHREGVAQCKRHGS